MLHFFLFLFPFPLFISFLPHFSSLCFFLFVFLFSFFLFVLFLFYSSFLSSLPTHPSLPLLLLFSSSTKLIHFLPLSILVTHGFHVSPSYSFPLTSVLHDTRNSYLCDSWPPSFFPCGIHHPHDPFCDGHDVVWHHATCHSIIFPFHIEMHEIPTNSEFNVICQGS